jgi:hypothetical protein
VIFLQRQHVLHFQVLKLFLEALAQLRQFLLADLFFFVELVVSFELVVALLELIELIDPVLQALVFLQDLFRFLGVVPEFGLASAFFIGLDFLTLLSDVKDNLPGPLRGPLELASPLLSWQSRVWVLQCRGGIEALR